MKELKKIQLIESPREEINLGEDGMSYLLGGNAYYCAGTYTRSIILGPDICSGTFSTGLCGTADNYCKKYSSCWLKYY